MLSSFAFICDLVYIVVMNVSEFVRMMVTSLTGAEPEIDVFEDRDGLVVKIVPFGNVSCLIGSKGRNLKALQTLAIAMGHKGKHRIHVYVDEENNKS